MYNRYHFKTADELLSADLARIESPLYAREAVRFALHCKDLPASYIHRFNLNAYPNDHEERIVQAVDEGELFAVCEPWRKPLRPLLRWVEATQAAAGGRWELDTPWFSNSLRLHANLYPVLQRFAWSSRARPPQAADASAPKERAVKEKEEKLASVFIQLHYPPGVNASSRYTLRGAKGFSAEKSAQDDAIPGNDTLDFEFTEVPVDDTYSLIVTTDHEEVTLFENIEFNDIRMKAFE